MVPLPPRRAGLDLPRWLAAAAVVAVLCLSVLLIVFYRVPWGGAFNTSSAGPASAWVGDLLTSLGILGLIYQLSQFRISRVDGTTREINSLYTHTTTRPWRRAMVVDGKLIYVYVQNDGERKAMDVEVTATLHSGRPIPDDWMIDRLHRFSLPPSTPVPIRALLLHIPSNQEEAAFGSLGRLVVTISWTDPWSRRVIMTDNSPSMIVAQAA